VATWTWYVVAPDTADHLNDTDDTCPPDPSAGESSAGVESIVWNQREVEYAPLPAAFFA
jgi:hypothetical protein